MNDERVVDLLHKKGYTFFNMPKLTNPELNVIIKNHNKEINEKKKAAQKQKAKKGRR